MDWLALSKVDEIATGALFGIPAVALSLCFARSLARSSISKSRQQSLRAACCCVLQDTRTTHHTPHTHTHTHTRTHTAETQTTIDLQVRRVVPSVVLLVLGSERQPLPGQARASDRSHPVSVRQNTRQAIHGNPGGAATKTIKTRSPAASLCPLSFLFLNIFFYSSASDNHHS